MGHLREAWEKAKSEFATAKTVANGYLRLEVPLNAKVTNLSFNVLANVGTQFVTEKRLQISDGILIHDIGFYLGLSGPAPGSDTDAAHNQMALYSWPNPDPTIFGAGVASAASVLQALYHGYWKLSVNQEVIVESQQMRRYYRSPDRVGALGIDSTSNDAWVFPNTGYFPQQPYIKLTGRDKIDFQIQLNAATDFGTNTGHSLYGVFILDGFLASNIF